MPQDWQSVVDSSLVRRLMRPLEQPGAIGHQLGNAILARTEQMTSHLPLLVQFAQRQVGVFQPDQIPIVYAQPSSSVEVINSHTETSIEPLTIVQATLISNMTSNDYTSSSTNLSFGESRQEHTHLTNLNRVRSQFFQQGTTNAIAAPISQQSSSSQNLSIVYAQTISNEFKNDRSNQRLTVRPLTLETSKVQSPAKLEPSQGTSLPQVTPIRPVSPITPIITVRNTATEAPPPIITVRTGTEADPPEGTWQTRTHLNETATTLPIVFAQPNPAPTPSQSTSKAQAELPQASEFLSFFPPVTETFSAPPSTPPINLDTLTTQVERKLLRRLVVESERRGQTRWR